MGAAVGVRVGVTFFVAVGVTRLVFVGDTLDVGVARAESFSSASVRISVVMESSGKSKSSCQYSAAFSGFSRFSNVIAAQ